ncbi:hypothetical protein [Pseudooceanicola algae]|uniref:PRC-barrel domain protein n=1 Tax=Pseudooceanicola algae TaxID=1537215 RepID=A0A418SFJ3_9RHOB|nr:hypothetical protein [Pseudooceanicola algae]QPM89862.1 hypothetical protein PSAL_010910 [Pseudooceanicola algae]
MNTFSKILTGVSVAALLPLTAMAQSTDNGVPAEVDQAFGEATAPNAEGGMSSEGDLEVIAGTDDEEGTVDPSGLDAPMATGEEYAPDQIEIAEMDFDAVLADATLVDGILEDSLVVSSDRKMVGNVNAVYEKPNGQMLADVTLSSELDTDEARALVPVSEVADNGNIVMKDDFTTIRDTFIQTEGSKTME